MSFLWPGFLLLLGLIPLMVAIISYHDWSTVVHYIQHGVNMTEPAFVDMTEDGWLFKCECKGIFLFLFTDSKRGYDMCHCPHCSKKHLIDY